MYLKHLDSNEFDEIIYDNSEPGLVIFSRGSCSICQNVLRILEDIQAKYSGKCNFFYIDAEKHINLSQRFTIRGVPQILFFNEGEYKGKLAGNVDSDQIEKKLAEVFE